MPDEGLPMELVKWAAEEPLKYEYSFVCVFCDSEEREEHKPDCFYLRAKAYLEEMRLEEITNELKTRGTL